ncbi:DUF2867 domain-containing protein [Arthrospiribacter ruber]|uniref:DUF2867 domain-containing protein n=1 Tax=Arthrospiribacter ruber TaxID=2487934 RepID=A0A951IZP7_9BACT|nr:DUF2867 domain-containing protein [Arthrospiribacter ruber]MBW3469357.1 DUF2867 domain-containing protein [Arthrospiribacter ruber]
MKKSTKPIEETFEFPLKSGPAQVWQKIINIGGENGWYYGTALWKLRGIVDRLMGGIGYRKGRKPPHLLQVGDAIDFWRLCSLDREKRSMKLLAEMKLPGKVYLEWTVDQTTLVQKTTFLPNDKKGKAYWVMVRPLHYLVFKLMGKSIARG